MIGLISAGSDYARLGKVLESERLVSKAQFKETLKRARQEGRSVYETLFERDQVVVDQLVQAVGAFLQIPVVRLRDMVIAPAVLSLLPKEIAEQHSVIVFKKVKD